MDDLLQEFIAETSDNMAALDNDLVDLERHPDDADLIGRIFRVVHTVKGNCGFLGLPRLENVAHHAENVLGQYRSGALKVTPDSVSLILQSLDRIKEILGALASTGQEPRGDDVALISLLDMAASGSAAGEKPKAHEERKDTAAPASFRISVDTLESIMTTVGELVLTRNRLLPLAGEGALKEPLHCLDRAVSQLQEGVMRARMQPVSLLWDKMPRLVRDAAAHGIEKPAARVMQGKPPEGVIRLAARQEGGQVVMTVSDDGRGLDVPAILERAAERGIADEGKLKALTPRQAWQLILTPGFTTAQEVTPVAGRGVGMDVVRENLEKAGGTLDISSTPGKGTVFTLRIPLTLSITPALLVQVENLRVAIPQGAVREVVRLRRDGPHRMEKIDKTRFLRLRDALLPLVQLQSLLGYDKASAKSLNPFVAVIGEGDGAFGILVDRVLATEEIVTKPVHRVFRGQKIFSGNAVLGDGGVVMVLDPYAVAETAGIAMKQAQESARPETPARETARLLLFRAGAEFAAVPLCDILRIEEAGPESIESAGGCKVMQYQGKLLPLVAFGKTGAVPGRQPILVLERDGKTAGLMIEGVLDIVEAEAAPPEPPARQGILGTSVVAGLAVSIVDAAHFVRQVHDG